MALPLLLAVRMTSDNETKERKVPATKKRSRRDDHEPQHNLKIAQFNAREQEIKRIATMLHDQASQLVVAVRWGLDDLIRRAKPSEKKALASIKSFLVQVEDQLRDLSHELHPAILDSLGLEHSLKFLGHLISKRSGIDITYRGSVDADLSPTAKLIVYRVIQEALTNITRHARAHQVDIKSWETVTAYHWSIIDNGVGFTPKLHKSGHQSSEWRGLGLALALERIEAVGGKLEIYSAPGKGCRLEITLPKGADKSLKTEA